MKRFSPVMLAWVEPNLTRRTFLNILPNLHHPSEPLKDCVCRKFAAPLQMKMKKLLSFVKNKHFMQVVLERNHPK